MVDRSPWISVADLAKGFTGDSNALSPTAELAGKSITLCSEHTVTQWTFESSSRLEIRSSQDQSKADSISGQAEYAATTIRPGIYLVSLLNKLGHQQTSLILNLNGNLFTSVRGKLPSEEEARRPLLERIAKGQELTGVTAAIEHGTPNTSPRSSLSASEFNTPTVKPNNTNISISTQSFTLGIAYAAQRKASRIRIGVAPTRSMIGFISLCGAKRLFPPLESFS